MPPKAQPFHPRPVTSWNAIDYIVSFGNIQKEFEERQKEMKGRRHTTSGNLLAGSSNTDDDALAPTLVAGFEGRTHDAHVTRAVKGVVASTVGHIDQLLLDGLAVQLGGVDEVGGAELARPRLLAVVDVHGDDLARAVAHSSLDDGETDAAGAEDGHVGALLHLGGHRRGAVARRDAAAQQARPVGGDLGSHRHDGDVCDDCVLREGRRAHEVQQVLAAGLEARAAVGHDALALGRADLAAQVRLAGLAELAFAAFGGAERRG